MTAKKVRSIVIIVSFAWLAFLTVLNLIAFHHVGIILDGDQIHYDGMARLLVTLHVYNYWLDPSPAAMAMPGYPLFVSLIYSVFGIGSHRLNHLWLAQFLLYLISVALIYRFGKRVGGPALGAIMAALLATLPFVFSEPFVALTENLAIPVFLLYVNLLYEVYKRDISTRWWVALGLSIGLMALVRPGLAELGLVPLILLLRRTVPHRQWGVVVVFLIACALPLVPWWIRNLIDFHQFFLFDKGEAPNTILAGTYPGYANGIRIPDIAQINQMALAKHRIIQGFLHEPFKYLMWFTVWRFHYNFDYVYAPTPYAPIAYFKPVFRVYQWIIVWGSILMTLYFIRQKTFRHSFWMLLTYSNIVLILMLIPFHPEPRFAIYSVLLFGIVLIGALAERIRFRKVDLR